MCVSFCFVIVIFYVCVIDFYVKFFDIGISFDFSLKQLIFTYDTKYTLSPDIYPIIGGKLRIFMPKYSSIILKANSFEQ